MNRYFYVDSLGKQKGTFSPEELRAENIRPDTLVWTQGMADWARADSVEELRFLFEPKSMDAMPEHPQSPPPTTMYHTQNYYNPAPTQPKPKTYLVESILVTALPLFFCSNIFSLIGIAAIVYASQVESYFSQGNYAQAEVASKQARLWTRITFWISIGWLLLVIAAIVLIIVFGLSLGGLAAAASSSSAFL